MSITQFPNIGQGIQAQLLALTPQTGVTTHNLNPGMVVMVIEHSGGSQVRYRGSNTIAADYYVTETPAQIAALTPLISLTQLITVANSSTQRQFAFYTPPQNICEPYDVGTDYYLTLHHNFHGKQETIQVAESSADVIAAIAAALPSGGGGGTTVQTVTAAGGNQATATATTASIIRITGGAVDTGIRLDGATVGEQRVITNATTTRKAYYPAVGENFTGQADDLPMWLNPDETVRLTCSLATEWSRDEDESTQTVPGSGTVQGGGAINANTQVAIATNSFGNTANTLPTAVPGKTIKYVNAGTFVGRLFPAASDSIDSLGSNNVYQVSPGTSVDLICNTARFWVTATSQINTLAVNTIMTTTTGGTTQVIDRAGTMITSFNNGQVSFGAPIEEYNHFGESGPALDIITATQINGNRFSVNAGVEFGSLVLTGNQSYCEITNEHTDIQVCYVPSGHTIKDSALGYVFISPGATVRLALCSSTTAWAATTVNAGNQLLAARAPAGGVFGTPMMGSFANVTGGAANENIVLSAVCDRFGAVQNSTLVAIDLVEEDGTLIDTIPAGDTWRFSFDGTSWDAVAL